jgi:hypothetical protein
MGKQNQYLENIEIIQENSKATYQRKIELDGIWPHTENEAREYDMLMIKLDSVYRQLVAHMNSYYESEGRPKNAAVVLEKMVWCDNTISRIAVGWTS